jgi:transcriptional regulator with XRE-family HTH domain
MTELGWSQTRLARELGVSPQRVWDILNRDRGLNEATIRQLATALGIEIVVRPEEK